MDTKGRRRELGAATREARLTANLSQRDLATTAGTNQSYLWEIEAGRVSVGIDVLCSLADALGTSVRDLIRF